MSNKNILALGGLILGLGMILVAFIGFSITGQVAYYIQAVTEDSIWTDELKYINISYQPDYPVDNTTNPDVVENYKPVYAKAVVQRDVDLDNTGTILQGANIVVGLIGLVIVILVFFMNGGILDMIRGVGETVRE